MPTENKRSRGHRADDDGQSGTWKRRNDGKPSDESRSATSTATEESCGACDGAGELDDGRLCATCAGRGRVRR